MAFGLSRSAERRGFLGWPQGTIPSNGDIPSNSSISVVDPGIDGALRLSAVWSCVRLLSDLVSTLPLDAYRHMGDGRQRVSPAPRLLAAPSARCLPSQWRYQVMTSLLLRGNAYGLVAARDQHGYPTQIELIHPDLITAQVSPTSGEVSYLSHAGEPLPKADVWHLPAFMLPGWPIGLSPIAYSAVAISSGRAAEKFGADFFTSGGHPTGLVTSTEELDGEQASAIKRAFVRATVGREPAVLGAGLDYRPIQIAPGESQFLEAQQASVGTVARIFGVPAELIGGVSSGSAVTYANREQRAQDLLTFCVNGWLTRIEEALNAVTPAPLFCKFDTSALLRSDLQGRYKGYEIGIKAGFLTPNDALRMEDLPTFTGGDVHLWPPTSPMAPSSGGPA